MALELPAEGGCQCGAVRYRLTGEPVWLTVCHCNECKRASGGAFSMSLRMREADVTPIAGQTKAWSRLAESGRRVNCCFCEVCGTRLWHIPEGSGFVHVKPGTLDNPNQLAPRYEAWTKRKAPWLALDGLDRSFEGEPPVA